MKTILGICLTGVILLVMPLAAEAGPIEIDVRASSAPNYFGSPSWAGYQSNALASLTGNLGSTGNRTLDPTGYEIAGPIVDASDFFVTSFPSWMGVADPTAPFANENGNRMHFGLRAIGDGSTKFSLDDVNYAITSTDGLLDYSGNLSGTTLNGTSRFGLDYGTDGVMGTADDVWLIANQNSSTLMDAFFYVGVGNAFWPSGGATNQASIEDARAYVDTFNPYTMTGTYSIMQSTGSASVSTPSAVPLPGSIWMGLGLLSLLGIRRTRQRRRAAS